MKVRKLISIGLLIALFATFIFCGTVPQEHKGAALSAGLRTATGVLLGGDKEG